MLATILITVIWVFVLAVVGFFTLVYFLNRREAKQLECSYKDQRFAVNQLAKFAVCKDVIVNTTVRICKSVGISTESAQPIKGTLSQAPLTFDSRLRSDSLETQAPKKESQAS